MDEDLLLAGARHVVTEHREPDVADLLERRGADFELEYRGGARQRIADLIPTSLAHAASLRSSVDVEHRRGCIEQDHHARLPRDALAHRIAAGPGRPLLRAEPGREPDR